MDCDDKDLIRPVCQLPNGHVVISRHRPDHTVDTALAIPSVAGRPMAMGEEYVTTRKRDDGSYEIVDSYVHGAAKSGPAQVTTADYRRGWDRTFATRGGSA